jgi:hypothetical protein
VAHPICFSEKSRFIAYAAALGVAVFLSGLSASADGDIFWHLAAGRWIWSEGSLLTTDPFSSGAAGRPWADVHWLFQLGAYAVHSVAGLKGLVLVKAVLVAIGALVLLLTVRARAGQRSALGFALGLALALFVAREFLLLRPVIVTLLLLALFFASLERFRQRPHWAVLAPLPFLQVLWSNVQGLAPLGVWLVLSYGVAFLLDARFGSRRWFPFARESAQPVGFRGGAVLLLTGGVVAAASALTPYGLSGLSLPWRLFGRLLPSADNVYAQNIIENVPPLALDPALNGQFWHLKWFVGLSLFALVVSRRRLVLSQLLVFAGLLLLGLLANRNLLLLYWLGLPILSLWLAAPLRRAALLATPRARHGALWAGRLSLAGVLGLAGVAAAREPDLAQPAPFRVPQVSAELLRSRPAGSVFSADHYGGYLIWTLFPAQRPYLDTRLVLRSAAEFREFLGVVDAPQRFDEFERRHGFGAVVLPTVYPDRYLPLIAHLYRSPRWKLLFTDGSETLFVRREGYGDRGLSLDDPAVTRRIVADIERRYAAEPRVAGAARLSLATLELALLEFDAAELALLGDPSPEAAALRARARLLRGETDDAEQRARRLLEREPGDVRSLNLLALASLERGERDQAFQFLRRAAKAAPFDPETETIVRNLEESEHVSTR